MQPPPSVTTYSPHPTQATGGLRLRGGAWLPGTESPQLRRVLLALEDAGSAVTGGPENYATRCPAHDDDRPSLSIADGDDRVLFHCHANCTQKAVLDAVVDYAGLALSDFFFRPVRGEVATVAGLSERKKLPVDLLTWAGMCDSPHGIAQPYFESDPRRPYRSRLRWCLDSPRGPWLARPFPGHRITAYGAWRVPEFRAQGASLILVEGESDTLTLWHHGMPGLGFAGKGHPRHAIRSHPEIVDGIARIFLVEETEDYEERAFLRSVRRGLSDVGWSGELHPVRLPVKDVSDLHIQCSPDEFRVVFQTAQEEAMNGPRDWPAIGPIPIHAAEVGALVIKGKLGEEFSTRDVARRARHLHRPDVLAALRALEVANVVRRISQPRRVGRPAERFRRNPHLAHT